MRGFVQRAAPVVVGLGLVALLLTWVGGGDPREVIRALDHGELLLGDAQLYFLPQGERLLQGAAASHVDGAYLTPGAALWCGWWGAIFGERALFAWAVAAVSLVIALAWLGVELAGCTTWRGRVVVAACLGLSAPILHGLKWGTTSGWATLAIGLSALAMRGGRWRLAAVWIGMAIVAKPWAVLAIAALPGGARRWAGQVAVAAGVALAAGILLPSLLLGPAVVFDYCAALIADLGAGRVHFAVDPNSQSVVHVACRYLRVEAESRAALSAWLAWPSLLLGIGALVLLRPWLAGAQGRATHAAAVMWTLLAVPLAVPTAWPHDLQAVSLLLPCAFLASAAAGDERRAFRCLLVLAWAAQSVFAVWLVGPRWFGGLALPLLALVILALVSLRRGGQSTAAT